MSGIRNIIFNEIVNTHEYKFEDLSGLPDDRIEAERIILEGFLIKRMAASDVIVVLTPEKETDKTLEKEYLNSVFNEEISYILYEPLISRIPVLVLARHTADAKTFAKIFWDEDIKKLNPQYDPSRVLAIGLDLLNSNMARMIHDLPIFYNEMTLPFFDK